MNTDNFGKRDFKLDSKMIRTLST